MTTFYELYHKLVKDSVDKKEFDEREYCDYDKGHLDCLLHPKKHPLVWHVGKCECTDEQKEACAKNCPFDAVEKTDEGVNKINAEKCTGCSFCIDNCKAQNLAASKDTIAVLKEIQNKDKFIYALIAPAFLGQFSDEVTPGKLRSALKKVGFDGMIEVSLFADILTLKEALEFMQNIKTDKDYQLTSCCCPIWIAMIRKQFANLLEHVPPSVSPMVAGGRVVKKLYPDAITVFIGPCVAKKAEAREEDIKDAIDYVLTFEEANDIFKAMEINPADMEESVKDHSSRAGRIYARTGGVSEAVKSTMQKLGPEHPIHMRTAQADGVKYCREMVEEIAAGKIKANFYEGMGCIAGCAGGPKSIIGAQEATENVNRYGDSAAYATPIDNPYVIELLNKIGFDTVESLLEDNEIFTRKF